MSDILKTIVHTDERPDNVEYVILFLTLIYYFGYLVSVVLYKNVKFVSWVTVIITLLSSLIFLLHEWYNKKRGVLIIQYFILLIMMVYLCYCKNIG